MKLLYFDCFSGISGDMTIAALLDAGGSFHHLESELKKLPISAEYQLHVEKIVKNGIHATKFDVITNEKRGHRHFSDIAKMIEGSTLAEEVKVTAIRMFRYIAEAEATIHNSSIEKVHFHEVGAIDSIIDIVGTAVLLHEIKVDEIIFSPIPVGSGTISIDHGEYPVPAPATLKMLVGIPIQTSQLQAELTTPTGAAIAATHANSFGPMPTMKVEQIGYGAGTKTFKSSPNVLRVVIGEM